MVYTGLGYREEVGRLNEIRSNQRVNRSESQKSMMKPRDKDPSRDGVAVKNNVVCYS